MRQCKVGTKEYGLYCKIQNEIQDLICRSIDSSTNGKIDSNRLIQLSIEFTDKIMEEIENKLGETIWM